jgi:hypothetical protein
MAAGHRDRPRGPAVAAALAWCCLLLAVPPGAAAGHAAGLGLGLPGSPPAADWEGARIAPVADRHAAAVAQDEEDSPAQPTGSESPPWVPAFSFSLVLFATAILLWGAARARRGRRN